MSIVAVVFFVWLISCAFPSSGDRRGSGIGEVLAFVACAALLIVVSQVLLIGGVFLADWLGDMMLFPFTTMGLIVVAMAINGLVVSLIENRKTTFARYKELDDD